MRKRGKPVNVKKFRIIKEANEFYVKEKRWGLWFTCGGKCTCGCDGWNDIKSIEVKR